MGKGEIARTVGKGENARTNVLNRLLQQTHKNHVLFGKGINNPLSHNSKSLTTLKLRQIGKRLRYTKTNVFV